MSETGSTTGLLVKEITITTHKSPEAGANVAFTFGLPSGGQIRMVLPIAAIAIARLDAIQSHLEQALTEMGAAEAPLSH